MNTLVTPATSRRAAGPARRLAALIEGVIGLMERAPHSLIALVARFSISAVFWKSGQTKIEGFALDIVSGNLVAGWPRLSDNAVFLFREEYKLPLALALLGMTLVIQLFVYPDAYPTHGVWAAVLLFLMAHGPGRVSLDALISRYCRA